MPIDYRELTEQQYNERLRTAIVGSEGMHEDAQDIGDGRATIGWGYTLNRNNNVEIWRNSGIQLNERQWQQLAAIDNAPAADRTRLGLAFDRVLNGAEADLLLRSSLREYEGPATNANMPLSDERVALVSLTYNRGIGAVSNHPVVDAIQDGGRAEAWFQMRYNCWGSNAEYEGGLRKRRYAESQAFGLYDDPSNVGFDEARDVYRMFQLHRDEIQRVESRFGVTVDGDVARPNRIAQANRDYPGMTALYGDAQTISEALAPARQALLQGLRNEHPDLADRLTEANFDAGKIYLDPGRDLQRGANVGREARNATVEAVDENRAATIDSRRMTRGNNPREVDSNDLLIGEGGDDTLRAHRGNDILIGGAGHDRMEGGVGHDTYVVGDGDTVMDNDGRGELRWDGRLLTGGSRQEGDPANTYRSDDGRYTYALDGNTLTVSDRDGGSLRIENYARGDMGLQLSEPRTQGQGAEPRAEGRPAQDEGALAIERMSPQDRQIYDQMTAAVRQSRRDLSDEQVQNVAAAGLLEYHRRDSVVREAQDVGVYGDRLFASYFPHGREREPNFQANVRLDDVANTPARDSLQQLDSMTRERQMQSQVPQQGIQGPDQAPLDQQGQRMR